MDIEADKPDNATSDIGALIRSLRMAAGLSQRQLARLAGVSQSLIAKIETGKVNPRFETVQRILSALREYLARINVVDSVASRPVITVNVADPVRKAVALMDRYGFSQLPVLDNNGRVVGTVLESSILRALSERGASVLDEPVASVMEEPLPIVKRGESLEVVVRLLESHPAVLVVEEDGRLYGIVTKIDVLRSFARGGLQWNPRGV